MCLPISLKSARLAFFAMVLMPALVLAQKLPAGPQVLTFHSDVDDTEQPYGLYLPKNFNPAKKYPFVVMLHGAGSNHRLALRRVFGKSNAGGENDVEASRYFPKWPDVEYIVATPYVRGTMGYQGIAEKDVLDVVADVKKRFLIDEDRTYLTGLSMGGGGTLWIGLSRPDMWAAIAPVCPAPPEGTAPLISNAFNLPVRVFQGADDPVVRADSTRAWVQRLRDAGTRIEYTEYPGVQHDSWVNAYKDGQIFGWFAQFKRNRFPDRVRFATTQYKHSQAYWLTINELTTGLLATADAKFTAVNRLDVVVSNIQTFTLNLAGHPKLNLALPLTITVNGKVVSAKAARSITLTQQGDTWAVTTFNTPTLSKRAGAEGPITEAVSDRHIYVYGTGGNPSKEELDLRRAEAVKAADWSFYRGDFWGRVMVFPRVLSDKEVRPADVESSNLVLFGTKTTNGLIAQFSDRLPLQLTNEAAVNYGLAYIFPNGNDRYVLVNSGLSILSAPDLSNNITPLSRASSPAMLLATKKFQDYVLFDKTQVLVNGRFDQRWQVPAADAAKLKATGALAPTLLEKQSKQLVTMDGHTFRDLNKNGKLDVYEDSRQPVEARVNDVLQQMNLEEKAGMMFINGVTINDDGTLDRKPDAQGFAARLPTAPDYINGQKLTHFNYWQVPSTQALADGYNAIQQLAESSRLGIPVTIASDPRHYFSNNIFSLASVNGFSQWPEQLGFAALNDEKLTRQFADIARQEYVAVGIREALHPMADLATEPRWPRVSGTFGEDARISARMIKAYVLGFQGEKLGTESVACMTKHFSGGGPQKEGLDSHFEFQKGQVYPGKNFNYHLIPFEAAFEAHTASIMPYYGVPTGQTSENVGFSYNKDIITKLLREKYKYDGVVCTDWGLVTDVQMGLGIVWPARAWGVENLSREDRVKKIIDAGCDQFGGENCPELVVGLVKSGKISEQRIDQSIRRLLRQKFVLGLFDNPYVDAERAVQIVGRSDFRAAGEAAQRRSFTLLKNEAKTLPLQSGKWKIYVKNVDAKVAARYGTVVDNPKDADFAILRVNTPWYPVETQNPFAKGFHHGDLDFKGQEKEDILTLLNTVPTIVDIYLDRPAVIPEISAKARGLVANYGASDAALLDVIFGKVQPEGKLPFELPSSMEAVRKQKEDLPHDSERPLYPFGFGLKY